MKKSVIKHFQNLPSNKAEQFNEALKLYRKCPGKNLGQERFYNQAGYNSANLENLNYDLKKLTGVTEAEIRNTTSTFSAENKNVDTSKNASVANVPAPKEKTKAKFTAAETTSKEDVFKVAPEEVKKQIKLREEFPFLSEENCPDEFHILTGKKFTSYYAWVEAHKHLLVNISDLNTDNAPIAMSSQEIDALAIASVENFEVNQQIWQELNHYKETGKVLGKHPIFIERKLKNKISKLTNAAAAKRLVLLENYIRRDRNKSKKAKTPEDKEKYANKVVAWQTEDQLIKAQHNL